MFYKMRLKYFAFMFVFLFLINFISASECGTIGEVDYTTQKYCDIGGWKPLGEDGTTCLNDYECLNGCAEGVCGSAFSPFVKQEKNFFELIWERVRGIQCVPGEDDCADDGKLIKTCGSEGTWENKKEYLEGRCGWREEEEGFCSEDDGGEDYYVKGETSNREGVVFSDKCVKNNLLLEFFCGENEGVFSKEYTCPNGEQCSLGKCVKKTQSESTCEESDNGEDYYTFGTCTYQEKNYFDECIDEGNKILLEYFCVDNVLDFRQYDCSEEGKQCSFGKCVDLDCYPECEEDEACVSGICLKQSISCIFDNDCPEETQICFGKTEDEKMCIEKEFCFGGSEECSNENDQNSCLEISGCSWKIICDEEHLCKGDYSCKSGFCIENTIPFCTSCGDCDGPFGFKDCTYQKCHESCESEGECYFRGKKPLLDDCISLNKARELVDSCEDYSIEECANNPFNVGEECVVKDGKCVESCEETCEGKECGSDGCGGDCGTCTLGDKCNPEGRCVIIEECGDGKVTGSEACDGTDLNGKDCVYFEYGSGNLACYDREENKACTFDTSGCLGPEPLPVCENGLIQEPEICDSNSQACNATWGYLGEEECNSDCDGWEECVATEYCGDEIINGYEECDGIAHCIAHGKYGECECAKGYLFDKEQKICVKDSWTGTDCFSKGEESCFGSSENLFICNSNFKLFNLGPVDGFCNYTSNYINEYANVTNGVYVPSNPDISKLIVNITDLIGASKIYIELLPIQEKTIGSGQTKVVHPFEINVDINTKGHLNFKLQKLITTPENVSLRIREEKWEKEQTNLTSSDDEDYFFNSQMSHFSFFMVTDIDDEEIINPPNPNPPGPNPGSSCTPDWKCTEWSLGICGTRTCLDLKYCGSLIGKPLETKNCSNEGYCGDEVCDIYENCGSSNSPPECILDCGVCAIGVCGDGICDADESSYLCAEDCTAVKPKSRIWIFILIIILLVAGILVTVFSIIRKLKKSKKDFKTGQGNVSPSQPRAPPRPPVSLLARGYPIKAHNSGFHMQTPKSVPSNFPDKSQ